MKHVFIAIFALCLLPLTLWSRTPEQMAKATLESYIRMNSHKKYIKLPKIGKKKFYSLCDSLEVSFIVGLESGICVLLSVDHAGTIEYFPMNVTVLKVGWGASIGADFIDLHQIQGVTSLDDVAGYYMIASSGIGAISSVRENWFTIKLTTKGLIGNGPEYDTTGFMVKSDILSLGLLSYKVRKSSKKQVMKFLSGP